MKDIKEEILNSVYNVSLDSHDGYSKSTAYKAMEQYAMERAVGFANHVLNDVSKSFYNSSLTITTNNDYYQQYLESIPQPSK